MPGITFKLYVIGAGLAGAAAVAAAAIEWRIGDPAALLGYLVLTLVAQNSHVAVLLIQQPCEDRNDCRQR